jgi:hypothetical protein
VFLRARMAVDLFNFDFFFLKQEEQQQNVILKECYS